jgi:hypothetical protein
MMLIMLILVCGLSMNIRDYLFLVNYVAVGSMQGAIELFDVDLVDQLEPMHTFEKKHKKKKSKKASKVCFN